MNLQFVNETEAVISESLGNGDYGDFNLKRGLDTDSDSDPDGVPSKRCDYGGVSGTKPGKKTKGRVKIKMEFIENKLRRYTTFSKRKTGIMKKAYELSTLTGTQVMLLVASETGHVYTFATKKLQPMITSESGKALIQTCLNSPDALMVSPSQNQSSDQRMNPGGFEEPELSYGAVSEDEQDDGSSLDRPEELCKTSVQGHIPSISPQPPANNTTHTSNPGASSALPNNSMSVPITVVPTQSQPPQLQPPPAHMGIQVTHAITQPPQAHMGPAATIMTSMPGSSPSLSRTLTMATPLTSQLVQQSTPANVGTKPTISMQLPNGGLTLLPNNMSAATPITISPIPQQQTPPQQPQQPSLQGQTQQQQQILTAPQQSATAQQPVYRIQTPSGQFITIPGLGQLATSNSPQQAASNMTLASMSHTGSQSQLSQPISVVSGSASSAANPIMYQTPQGIMYAAANSLPEGYIINLPQNPAINIHTDPKQPGAQYITIPVPVSLAAPGAATPQMLQPILAQASSAADTRQVKAPK